MASPAITKSTTVSSHPFHIQELQVTTGATAGNVAHSCPREPDLVIVQSFGAIDNSNEVAIVSKDGTNLNVDCEDDGNNTVYIYCICFNKTTATGSFGVAP
jgi:hypothetical protein